MEAAHGGVSQPRWEGYEKKEPDPKTKPVGLNRKRSINKGLVNGRY